jgi:class 3 adenylate cyclase
VDDVQIRYAKSGDAHVAYQVLGDGPFDLLELNNGTILSIDAIADEPHWRRWEDRLASFARLIRFDLRGIGLSDPFSGGSPSVDAWTDDALAVLNAAGSERAAVMGMSTGALIALTLAVREPSRVSALVLVHATARTLRAPDYPAGVPEETFRAFLGGLLDTDSPAGNADDIAMMAPSLVGDRQFCEWWLRAGHRSSSPAAARAQHEAAFWTDVRDLLPAIATPTVVVHRVDNPFVRVGNGRYLAEHIAGAKYVELPGADHLPFAGDAETLLDEVQEFLTGERPVPGAERILATVLFTDIVGSTERAARLGDHEWRHLLEEHNEIIRHQLGRFGGREVNTTGDGVLAVFDAPARAIRCALAIRESLRGADISVRAGLHTGEIEVMTGGVGGIAVHIGARVSALAGADEILVSSTVKDLVTGSGITFEDRGQHELKGVPETWRVWAVVSG